MKSELHSLVREILSRCQEQGLEVVHDVPGCPDSPQNGMTRRDLLGRLGLLLAGAAALKVQGCGACNDIMCDDAADSGVDANDGSSGCAADGCTLDSCTNDVDAGCPSDNPCDTCNDPTCEDQPTCNDPTCNDIPCDTTDSSFF